MYEYVMLDAENLQVDDGGRGDDNMSKVNICTSKWFWEEVYFPLTSAA